VNYAEAAEFLKSSDNFYILTHQSPDGDTLGSGYALCRALRQMKKKANLLCHDDIPSKYGYLSIGVESQRFSPKTVVAVDVADEALLGQKFAKYAKYVDLCIDHHISNSLFASKTLLGSRAAAAGEIVYRLIAEMDVGLNAEMAEALYTGITSDTGCFKFSNTTAETHIIASELMRFGIDCAKINRRLFDVKSRGKIALEAYIMSEMEYYLDGKCALAAITKETFEKLGAGPEDAEEMAHLTVSPEGVEVGIFIKEKEDGVYRVSMRSVSYADVSEICRKFDGGGHTRAAGCTVEGKLGDVKLKLLSATASKMDIDLWVV